MYDANVETFIDNYLFKEKITRGLTNILIESFHPRTIKRTIITKTPYWVGESKSLNTIHAFNWAFNKYYDTSNTPPKFIKKIIKKEYPFIANIFKISCEITTDEHPITKIVLKEMCVKIIARDFVNDVFSKFI